MQPGIVGYLAEALGGIVDPCEPLFIEALPEPCKVDFLPDVIGCKIYLLHHDVPGWEEVGNSGSMHDLRIDLDALAVEV